MVAVLARLKTCVDESIQSSRWQFGFHAFAIEKLLKMRDMCEHSKLHLCLSSVSPKTAYLTIQTHKDG